MTRYRLLETIRQYAEERLVEAGESGDRHLAHARYWVGEAVGWAGRSCPGPSPRSGPPWRWSTRTSGWRSSRGSTTDPRWRTRLLRALYPVALFHIDAALDYGPWADELVTHRLADGRAGTVPTVVSALAIHRAAFVGDFARMDDLIDELHGAEDVDPVATSPC